IERREIAELVSRSDVRLYEAGSAKEALALLREHPVDCVVIDLRLPDGSGLKLLEQIRKREELASLPAIVYTAADVAGPQLATLTRGGATVLTKGKDAPAKLVEAVYEHVGHARRTPAKPGATAVGDELRGRRVLVVDDDIRNIFALTAMLERQ